MKHVRQRGQGRDLSTQGQVLQIVEILESTGCSLVLPQSTKADEIDLDAVPIIRQPFGIALATCSSPSKLKNSLKSSGSPGAIVDPSECLHGAKPRGGRLGLPVVAQAWFGELVVEGHHGAIDPGLNVAGRLGGDGHGLHCRDGMAFDQQQQGRAQGVDDGHVVKG